MSIYKRGDTWWYKFKWSGESIRESTGQGNQRTAEKIEAARKTELAKGEVGIKDRKRTPTLAEFAEYKFLPFVEEQKAGKPKTIKFYKDRIACLRTYPRLWRKRLDLIEPEAISAYAGTRRARGMETSTINRDLATLRRMFKLAEEWGAVSKIMPKVRMLPGENRRERVVTVAEEKLYLAGAAPLLRDFAVLEFDCGLRPEEAHRLKWDQIRGGNVEIHTGKTEHARRSIPASPRVLDMLLQRRTDSQGDWVFPAPTTTGHINEDSLKKQHAAAIADSRVDAFVVYSLRHTCLTRWAESGMDVFTLKRLAGHAKIETTMRYVHMSGARDRAAMEKVWRGHKTGHSGKNEPVPITAVGDLKLLKSVG